MVELQDYFRILRKRWRLVAGTLVGVLLVGGVITYLTPAQYQSNAQLFVSTSNVSSTSDLAAGSNFTQRQVKTYADIARTPAVLGPVIARLQLSETPADLAERVTATVPVDTVLINIAVTDPDPGMSQRLATAIADQFRALVPDLETVNDGDSSPVKVTVVQSPALGEQVVPQPVRNMGLAGVLGLLLGLGLAVLRETLDTSVKSDKDVQQITDTTIIGGIHFDKDAPNHPLIVQADPQGARAEAFRSVRTNLQFIDVSNPPRAFAITSSLPGEGKSTTAANLALTIAAGGSTVCVIEGDLRRSRLLAYMGLESGVGLTNVLINEADLDDVLQSFADTNVTVLGAGPVPPNPSELLGSDRMREVLDELRERFDYVIIDTPPLLPVTDAAVVSKLVDGAVLVVGAGVIHREHLARSLEILDTVDAHTLGIVLNRLPVKSGSGYYGYSYYGDYKSDIPSTGGEKPSRFRKDGKKAGGSTAAAVTAQGESAQRSSSVMTNPADAHVSADRFDDKDGGSSSTRSWVTS